MSVGMMLEAFANDKLRPGSQFFKRDSEYGQALERLVDAESALLTSLDANEKKLYEELADAQGLVDALSGTDRFLIGYKVGVMMTTEVFLESGELITGAKDG